MDIRLIQDTPSTQDRFGPHSRISSCLADLIKKRQRAMTIGLEGGWGSGKTTVISLLQKELKPEEDVRVVVFDTWAHEGDPLRRSLLEKLIRFFIRCNWIGKEEWENNLQELANRKTTKRTTREPYLSPLGKWMAFSVLLVPFGSALANAAYVRGTLITFDSTLGLDWPFLFGLLLGLAPFGVLAVNWLRGKFLGRGGKPLPRDFWSFHHTEARSQVSSSTVKTPEPTSVEFQDTYDKAIEEALKNSERRLVLVFDNLDRIAPDEARRVWSTLQLFTQRQTQQPWQKRLWVIIPFDRDGIRSLWQEETGKDAANNNATKGSDVNLADSFLDKAFQITFHVPPPLLSNWKAYLEDLAKRHLGVDSGHTIYRIFDICHYRVKHTTPTPRELKLLVNQIGSLLLQWPDTYPIQDVAYYALQRRLNPRINDLLRKLRDGNMPDDSHGALLSDSIKENLAGLAFNVLPDEGVQLLLVEPIREALIEGNASQLATLEANHAKGFWPVLDRVLTEWQGSEAKDLFAAASCLGQTDFFRQNESDEARAVVEELSRKTTQVKWDLLEPATMQGIEALCHLNENQDFRKQLLQQISQRLEHMEPITGEKIPPLLQLLISATTAIGHKNLEETENYLTLPIDTFPLWQSASKQLLGTHLAKHCLPMLAASTIANETADLINGGTFQNHGLSIVQVQLAQKGEFPWPTITDAAANRLRAEINATEAASLLQALAAIETQLPDQSNQLNALVEQGHMHHLMHKAQSENQLHAKAHCLLACIRHDPALPPATTPFGQSAEGHGVLRTLLKQADDPLVKEVTALAKKHGFLAPLLQLLEHAPVSRSFVIRCIRELYEQDGGLPDEVCNPASLLAHWPVFHEALSDNFNSVAANLAEAHDLVEHIISTTFSPDDSLLFLAVLQTKPTAEFAQWCSEGIASMNEQQWNEEFQAPGHIIDLMAHAVVKEHGFSLDHKFSDAMSAFTITALSNQETPPSETVTNWKTYFSFLTAYQKRTLRSKACRDMVATDGKIPDSFFDMCEGILTAKDVFGTKNAVSRCCTPLLKNRNPRGLRWLGTLLQGKAKSQLEQHSDSDAVQDFKRRIPDALSHHPPDEATEHIRLIAEALGIPLPQSEPPSEDQEDVSE